MGSVLVCELLEINAKHRKQLLKNSGFMCREISRLSSNLSQSFAFVANVAALHALIFKSSLDKRK